MESRCHCKDIGIENFVKDVQVFAILRFYADRNTCAGNGDIDAAAGRIEFTGFFD